MNKELNVFTLRMLRDQYQAEHLDTEAEALEAAIAALEQPELIEQGAYVRGFEQGRTQGMLDAKLQPTCNQLATDCISRQAVIDAIVTWTVEDRPDAEMPTDLVGRINALPSAQPYTEAEIQKMQDLEQAELDKAFELGQQDAQPEIIRCKNCTWWSNDEYRECSSPNYNNVHVTPAGFYCGWAERRIDGTNVGDTISRQAAINALCKSGCDSTYCGVSCPDVMAIENLPSAQPEQHGVCRDCTMKNICRYKTGLGDYGYCSQWRGEEHGEA